MAQKVIVSASYKRLALWSLWFICLWKMYRITWSPGGFIYEYVIWETIPIKLYIIEVTTIIKLWQFHPKTRHGDRKTIFTWSFFSFSIHDFVSISYFLPNPIEPMYRFMKKSISSHRLIVRDSHIDTSSTHSKCFSSLLTCLFSNVHNISDTFE